MYRNRYSDNPQIKHLTPEEVENWYPKSLSEKVDMILLALYSLTDYFGATIVLNSQEIRSLFLTKSRGKKGNYDQNQVFEQLEMIVRLLENDNKYIEMSYNETTSSIKLLPAAFIRIDELQRTKVNSRTAFVAMSFAPEMNEVQEAIKKAITNAHYLPCVMNEIEHNKQIVPEMLHEIRNCRFLIAELTNHNNGAYYEAGYAHGYGKEVIFVCKHERLKEDGHFDVAQNNMVLWTTYEDLVDKLYKRIKATFDTDDK